MATTFFTDLFTRLDTVSNELSIGMSNLFNVVMPAFEACFVVYVIMVVWSYWQNESPPHVLFTDLVKRIFLLGLLMGLGINISTYTSTVFPLVTHLGNDLAVAWSGNQNASMGSMLDGIVTKVSEITDTNQKQAEEAIDTPPTDPNSEGIIDSVIGAVNSATDAVIGATIGQLGNKLYAYWQNLVIWLSACVFLVISCAYLLIATTMLILLATVGPVFFAFGIFPATRQFFTNWIGQVLNYSFLFLFINVMATMFVTFIDSSLDAMKNQFLGGQYTITGEILMTLICMFVVFGVILLQLPQLTSSLFGGLAAGGFANALSAAKSLLAGGKGKKGNDKGKDSGGAVEPEDSGGAVEPEGKRLT